MYTDFDKGLHLYCADKLSQEGGMEGGLVDGIGGCDRVLRFKMSTNTVEQGTKRRLTERKL